MLTCCMLHIECGVLRVMCCMWRAAPLHKNGIFMLDLSCIVHVVCGSKVLHVACCMLRVASCTGSRWSLCSFWRIWNVPKTFGKHYTFSIECERIPFICNWKFVTFSTKTYNVFKYFSEHFRILRNVFLRTKVPCARASNLGANADAHLWHLQN